MTDPAGERIAAAALTLLGTPFRLHGRHPETGLDCVGLVLLSLRRAGIAAAEPPPYTLKGASLTLVTELAAKARLMPCTGPSQGDIVLARSGPGQFHLMIQSNGGFVHAHAGLGRTVLMPAPSPWPIMARWCAAAES